jgi:hypothetical protein
MPIPGGYTVVTLPPLAPPSSLTLSFQASFTTRVISVMPLLGLPNELLLDMSDYLKSPLLLASNRGYEAVVKMLLDNGADVNAQGGEYGNALQAALEGDRKAVVKMLLDNGALNMTLTPV